jgi:hypothetical protein
MKKIKDYASFSHPFLKFIKSIHMFALGKEVDNKYFASSKRMTSAYGL